MAKPFSLGREKKTTNKELKILPVIIFNLLQMCSYSSSSSRSVIIQTSFVRISQRKSLMCFNTRNLEEKDHVTSARQKRIVVGVAWHSLLCPPPPSAAAVDLASLMTPVASQIIYESFSSPAVLGRFALTACDVINHPSEMLCVPLSLHPTPTAAPPPWQPVAVQICGGVGHWDN